MSTLIHCCAIQHCQQFEHSLTDGIKIEDKHQKCYDLYGIYIYSIKSKIKWTLISGMAAFVIVVLTLVLYGSIDFYAKKGVMKTYRYSDTRRQDRVTKMKAVLKNLQEKSVEILTGEQSTVTAEGRVTSSPTGASNQAHFPNIKIKEQETFRPLDNESYMYVRSAYLDYRFNPPVIQILTVMGGHIFSYSKAIRCQFMRYKYNRTEVQTVEGALMKLRNPINCFFRSVAVSCKASLANPPDYVSLSYKEIG